MFHLIKRVIKWGNRTVTIYIGPAEENEPDKNLGLRIWAFICCGSVVLHWKQGMTAEEKSC